MSDYEVQKRKEKGQIVALYYLVGAVMVTSGTWITWGWQAALISAGIAIMVAAVIETFS